MSVSLRKSSVLIRLITSLFVSWSDWKTMFFTTHSAFTASCSFLDIESCAIVSMALLSMII